MPARAFVIRFPSGDYEYDVTRHALPSIGETVRKQGRLWSVTRITQDERVTIHVASSADDTDREDEERHPLESEEALLDPARAQEGEPEGVPHPGPVTDEED